MKKGLPKIMLNPQKVTAQWNWLLVVHKCNLSSLFGFIRPAGLSCVFVFIRTYRFNFGLRFVIFGDCLFPLCLFLLETFRIVICFSVIYAQFLVIYLMFVSIKTFQKKRLMNYLQ